MSPLFKKFLIKLKIYERIKWSKSFLIFQNIINPLQRKIQNQEAGFLSKIIKPGSLCFDIGANVGEKTDIFLRLGAKRIIAVEPDRKNAKILAVKYKRIPKVTIVEGAVSDRVGTEAMMVEGEGSGFNTLSNKWKDCLENKEVNRWHQKFCFRDRRYVSTITLDSLIQSYGVPDFIKVDVEGYELRVIEGLSQKISLICFEANLPEFLNETIESIRHLRDINPCTKFNFAIGDGIKFEIDHWVDYSEMIRRIKSNAFRFMDIYAKSTAT